MSAKPIRDLIADNAYAITFQTMGQYRTALIKAIDDLAILAAHSADARNGEGVDVAGIVHMARQKELQADGGGWVYSVERIAEKFAAPAAPAPKRTHSDRDGTPRYSRRFAPAPAAQADEELPQHANDDRAVFSASTVRRLWELKEHYRNLCSQQSATPAEPDYRKELAEAMGLPDGLTSGGKRVGLAWELLISYVNDWRGAIEEMERATPADAASEADKRDAERYRVLRDERYQLDEDDISVSDSNFQTYFGDELDAAVDALAQRERQQGAGK